MKAESVGAKLALLKSGVGFTLTTERRRESDVDQSPSRKIKKFKDRPDSGGAHL